MNDVTKCNLIFYECIRAINHWCITACVFTIYYLTLIATCIKVKDHGHVILIVFIVLRSHFAIFIDNLKV